MEPAPEPEGEQLQQPFPETADDPTLTLCFSCEEEGTQFMFPWKMCEPGSQYEQIELIHELQIDLCEDCLQYLSVFRSGSCCIQRVDRSRKLATVFPA